MLPTLFKQRAGLKPHARAAAAMVLVFAATIAPEANAAGDPGPFAHLAGSWSGAGTITTSSGARERIRCAATYRVGEAGHAFQQDLRCASDSYKFYVISVVRAEGGRNLWNLVRDKPQRQWRYHGKRERLSNSGDGQRRGLFGGTCGDNARHEPIRDHTAGRRHD